MTIKWRLVGLFVVCFAVAMLLTAAVCPYPYDCGWQLWAN
jgi:hypothetical protein